MKYQEISFQRIWVFTWIRNLYEKSALPKEENKSI